MSNILPLRLNFSVPSLSIGREVSLPRMANLFVHGQYEMKVLKSGIITSVVPESAQASSGSSDVNRRASKDESKACAMACTRDTIVLGMVEARCADVWHLTRWFTTLSNLR